MLHTPDHFPQFLPFDCVLRVQSAIRVGDVFAVLVEYFYMQRNMEQAFRLIENMRQRGIVLAPFLDADLITTVYR